MDLSALQGDNPCGSNPNVAERARPSASNRRKLAGDLIEHALVVGEPEMKPTAWVRALADSRVCQRTRAKRMFAASELPSAKAT